MSKLDIKGAIKRHNLTINEIAAALGISRQALSTHIAGNPSVDVLQRIAAAIGCDVIDLFTPQEGTQSPVMRCPHCGGPLHISVNK